MLGMFSMFLDFIISKDELKDPDLGIYVILMIGHLMRENESVYDLCCKILDQVIYLVACKIKDSMGQHTDPFMNGTDQVSN